MKREGEGDTERKRHRNRAIERDGERDKSYFKKIGKTKYF